MERPVAPAAICLLGLSLIACGGAAPGEQPVSHPLARDLRPRIRVLGTAQDGGLPHAACHCPRCERARQEPGARRRVASLALELPRAGRVYLVDATPDLREQLDVLRDRHGAVESGVDRSPVDGVLLTHAHIGHYLGLAFFGFEAVHTRELPVFCSASLAAFLRTNGPWSRLVEIGNISLHELRPGEPLALGDGVSVTPFDVPHRREYSDTFGFLFEGPEARLLYVPDTDSWTSWEPPLRSRLEGIRVAILDGTFFSSDELPGRDVASIGHPLMRQTMELLEPLLPASGIEIHFTHLNHSNPALDPRGPERQEIEGRGFHVLAEGQAFPL